MEKNQSGLRVLMSITNKSLILEIPTKDRGILKYFTSVSGVQELLNRTRNVVYFNPRSDFSG